LKTGTNAGMAVSTRKLWVKGVRDRGH